MLKKPGRIFFFFTSQGMNGSLDEYFKSGLYLEAQQFEILRLLLLPCQPSDCELQTEMKWAESVNEAVQGSRSAEEGYDKLSSKCPDVTLALISEDSDSLTLAENSDDESFLSEDGVAPFGSRKARGHA